MGRNHVQLQGDLDNRQVEIVRDHVQFQGDPNNRQVEIARDHFPLQGNLINQSFDESVRILVESSRLGAMSPYYEWNDFDINILTDREFIIQFNSRLQLMSFNGNEFFMNFTQSVYKLIYLSY